MFTAAGVLQECSSKISLILQYIVGQCGSPLSPFHVILLFLRPSSRSIHRSLLALFVTPGREKPSTTFNYVTLKQKTESLFCRRGDHSNFISFYYYHIIILFFARPELIPKKGHIYIHTPETDATEARISPFTVAELGRATIVYSEQKNTHTIQYEGKGKPAYIGVADGGDRE